MISLRIPLSGLLLLTLLTACSRQFAISVNEQTLYDPRPLRGAVQLADPGLQSCLNLIMAQGNNDTVESITVLSCAGMEVTSLAGISALSGLQFIDVSNNRLQHLDELAQLRRLRSVTAENNALNDIRGILDTGTLSAVNVRGNPAIPCSQLAVLREGLQQNLLAPARCRE